MNPGYIPGKDLFNLFMKTTGMELHAFSLFLSPWNFIVIKKRNMKKNLKVVFK